MAATEGEVDNAHQSHCPSCMPSVCGRVYQRLNLPHWRLLLLAVVTSVLSLVNFGAIYSVMTVPYQTFESFFNQSFTVENNGRSMTVSELDLFWGLAVSIPNATAIIGGFLAIPLASRFGRKVPLMVLTNFVVIIGASLNAVSKFADRFELLILGRAVCGIALGSATTLLPVYLVEMSPPRHRGFVASLHGMCSGIAMLLSMLLSMPVILGNDTWWYLLVSFQIFPAILQICATPFCPESPQYLHIAKGKREEAAQILRNYFGPEDSVEDALESFVLESKREKKQMSIFTALRNEFHIRQGIILGFVAGMTQNFSAANIVSTYVTKILTFLKFSDNFSEYITVVGVVVAVPGVVLGPKAVQRFSRRKLFIYILIAMMVCLVVGFGFALLATEYDDSMSWAKWLAAAAILCNYGLYNFGPGPISWFIGPELTPEHARTAASASNLAGAYISALALTLPFPLLLDALNAYVFLALFVCPCTVCIIILYIFLPETNGRTTTEIIEEMERRHRGISKIGSHLNINNLIHSRDTGVSHPRTDSVTSEYGTIEIGSPRTGSRTSSLSENNAVV